MDYCIACHRHLNGALACAGCGTPAEHLIPGAPPRPAAASSAPESGPAALADVYADSLVVLSGAGRQGRAGARRRTTHRRRRRTLLAVGAGFLLAVGTMLGLARMVTDGERTDRAATVVLTDDAGPEEPAPLPGLTGAPAQPSAVPSGRTATVAAGSAKATAGGTKQAGPGRTAGGSAVPGPAASASGSQAAGPTRSATATGGGVQPTPSGPATAASSGAPTPSGSVTPTGPAPQPTPPKRPACPWWNLLCWE
ncbi:hypothetical protein J7E97_02490 [Streptomyces sp. ISL-66]|uniref:SCO2400 family protein n=1 Tax=Streptomyces sp. ISL-66 TaxID=2819186 RepID=UPI001BECDDCC|nr:hypothetical protein [Streptomyces sp. ISL-66]MBT2466765.1 hypothetical protein [Streptomyces sp. ISL-66]